jgi:hypothetical protein
MDALGAESCFYFEHPHDSDYDVAGFHCLVDPGVQGLQALVPDLRHDAELFYACALRDIQTNLSDSKRRKTLRGVCLISPMH